MDRRSYQPSHRHSLQHCPKCRRAPLPLDQGFPAACPHCGVILAKVSQRFADGLAGNNSDEDDDSAPSNASNFAQQLTDETEPWHAVLLAVPDRVDAMRFWFRCALWLGFAIWGLVLIAQDWRTGEIGESFIHRPLLIFHEAGHVVFMAFGHWLTVLGGTLGQLIMPAVMAIALLWKNRDPFGAAIGVWLIGVSLLDIAPYIFDALVPQLTLLSGGTGEEGGHDWIYLLSSLGWLPKAQVIGGLVHKLGALVVLLALAWAGWVLLLQHRRVADDVLMEN